MSDAEYTIRRARPDDLATIVELRVKMQTEALEIDEAGRERVREANIEYFRDNLDSEGLVAVLAEASGRAVATGALVLFDKPPSRADIRGREGYILNMYTEPEWRGRGVAGAVVEHLIAAAREADAALVWLRASEMGRPVYAKHGFTENRHYMQLWLKKS